MVPSRFLALLLMVSVVFGLSSCGFGRQGTAVVVWAPEGSSVANGDLVWVWDQSRIRKTVKVERPTGGGTFEMDQWRLVVFPGEGEALAFQKAFAPVKDRWAVSGKQGLPVRETADANANRVYKLGLDETVKVLQADGERIKQGNLEGTWIRILTQDGYSGWVFDYYLSMVDRSAGEDRQVKASGPGDQLVQAVVAQSWYPDEMRAMVEQDRIDLELFREDAGLRSVASPASFLLVLPQRGGTEERFEIPTDAPRKISDSTYDFGGPRRARLQFTNAEGSRLTLTFVDGGRDRTVALALLDENVGTLITQEVASRQQKLSEILVRGRTLTSPTWGQLTLTPEGTFTWQGLTTPLAGVSEGSGRLVFDWFKDKRLLGEFRAVRFQFGDDPTTAPSKVFLYRFLKDGFQLVPADEADLDPTKRTVVREGQSGVSLFFAFQE